MELTKLVGECDQEIELFKKRTKNSVPVLSSSLIYAKTLSENEKSIFYELKKYHSLFSRYGMYFAKLLHNYSSAKKKPKSELAAKKLCFIREYLSKINNILSEIQTLNLLFYSLNECNNLVANIESVKNLKPGLELAAMQYYSLQKLLLTNAKEGMCK